MNAGIQIERDERGIVTFRINNPAHRNAMNNDMIAALTAAFKAAAEDQQCRIVVLRGAGGIFCAGREINDIQTLQGAGMDVLNAAYSRLLELNLAAYYCPKPVVSVLERHDRRLVRHCAGRRRVPDRLPRSEDRLAANADNDPADTRRESQGRCGTAPDSAKYSCA